MGRSTERQIWINPRIAKMVEYCAAVETLRQKGKRCTMRKLVETAIEDYIKFKAQQERWVIPEELTDDDRFKEASEADRGEGEVQES